MLVFLSAFFCTHLNAGSIFGIVAHDVNNNNLHDLGDTDLGGLTIELWEGSCPDPQVDTSSTLLATTTLTDWGWYWFDQGISADKTYVVRVNIPVQWYYKANSQASCYCSEPFQPTGATPVNKLDSLLLYPGTSAFPLSVHGYSILAGWAGIH